MKTALKIQILFLVVLGTATLLHAQGTAFTYQGRLNNNGTPANGIYDLQFNLRDAATAGNPVGTPNTIAPVAVSNGLFTVTLDFGAGIFTGPSRWLEIGVRTNGSVAAYSPLSPRQPVTATPYAQYAASSGTGGNGIWSLNGASAYYNGGNVGVGTTTPVATLEVSGANGNTLLYATASRPNLIFRDTFAANARSVMGGFGGGFRFYTESFWSGADSSALMALDNNGNFGLGTTSPQSRLDVNAGSGQDALRLSGQTPFLTFLDTTVGYRSRIQAIGGDISLLTEGAINGTIPNAFLRLRGNGFVGIGTANPATTLDVRGYLTMDAGGDSALFTGTAASELNRYLLLINSPNLQSASGLKAGGLLVADSYGFANPGKSDLIVKGKFGLGTATPNHKLRIASTPAWTANSWGGAVELENAAAIAWRANAAGQRFGMGHSTGGFYLFRTASDPGTTGTPAVYDVTVDDSGNVGIGTGTPGTKLDVNGTTRTKILTITGGADLAEPFEMSHDNIPKGSVVVIDDEHPGRLRRSERAYDRRVAGIVSGANGINPGITLQQEGALADGQNVALSGRVYVQADTIGGRIEPGDFLTTSDTPGHAMKAADHARAQGAILGKAMSALNEGKGMLLVLVTLQ